MSFKTTAPYNITQNSFVSGGIGIPSGASITKKGICWSLDIIADGVLPTDKLEVSETDLNNFTLSVFGLTSNVKYYVKAYYLDSSSVYHFGILYSFFTEPSDSSITIDTVSFKEVDVIPNQTFVVPPGYELVGIDYNGVTPSLIKGCTTLSEITTAITV
jgi:hypothetical protein